MSENKKSKKTKEKTKEKTEKTEGKKEEPQFVIPALDFSSLVLPFFSQALVSLGQIEEDKKKQDDKNLELAKRLIDLLDLLRKRTKGNLKDEEEKFLEASLHQLKLAYMEKAKIIKL